METTDGAKSYQRLAKDFILFYFNLITSMTKISKDKISNTVKNQDLYMYHAHAQIRGKHKCANISDTKTQKKITHNAITHFCVRYNDIRD